MLKQNYRIFEMVCNGVVVMLSSIPLQLYTTEATRVMNTQLKGNSGKCIFTHPN